MPKTSTLDSMGVLRGRRVSMLVWNGFVYDARVTREAETLVGEGLHVQVTCVRTEESLPADEVTPGGVEVHRVSRRNRWLTMILLAPRGLAYVAVAWLKGRERRSLLRESFARRARWWELDRKLAMALELLVGNLRMFRAALSYRPDFVHANDVNTLFPGWLAARLADASLIYDAHEISADREGYYGRIWLVRLAEKYLGGQARGRITTTQARADWFVKNYGYEQISVVQNRPILSVSEGNRIRELLPIQPEHTVVLYQGGLQAGRGLHNLIEAIRSVPGAELVFVGDGRQRASLEAAAADISDRVHFVGQVPLSELPTWTASADIGMQTLRNTCLNHYTTDSNKLFEYVMGGLAVVASDFPEIRGVVNDYDLGILVDPDDVKQISEAIALLASEPIVRKRYQQNAINAREQLDWGSQVHSFLSVYAQAVDFD